MRKLRSLTTTVRKAIRGGIVKTCARAARGIKPVPSKVMNSRRFKCFPSGRGQIPYHAVACNAALCITAKLAGDVRLGCAPCKGGAFQWVQVPPGNSSSDSASVQAATRVNAGCGNGAMGEPLRHRQTKGAATDMLYLTPPRHISTLPIFRLGHARLRGPLYRQAVPTSATFGLTGSRIDLKRRHQA